MADQSQHGTARLTTLLIVLAVICLLLAATTLFFNALRRGDENRPASDHAAAQTQAPASGNTGFGYRIIPISKLPGPCRTFGPCVFTLNETNSQAMQGIDDPQNERLCDVAGNFYSSGFISQFSYAHPGSNGPIVRIRIEDKADTLKGRLEAHGLKPNFVYQIKLRGIYKDRRAFEAIGYAGRWRLPGRATNYSDLDYQAYPFKDAVEAYILFDFFMTNGDGDATRDFALDSSLHVLWNASRQGGDALADDMVPMIVDARRADLYLRPRRARTLEMIWAERESIRYAEVDQCIRLPTGPYSAELILTEESFHSPYNDGGYWATVCKAPITFTVSRP